MGQAFVRKYSGFRGKDSGLWAFVQRMSGFGGEGLIHLLVLHLDIFVLGRLALHALLVLHLDIHLLVGSGWLGLGAGAGWLAGAGAVGVGGEAVGWGPALGWSLKEISLEAIASKI